MSSLNSSFANHWDGFYADHLITYTSLSGPPGQAQEAFNLLKTNTRDFSEAINVLMTPTGLKGLLRLSKNPEFLNSVQQINFLHHSIPYLAIMEHKIDSDRSNPFVPLTQMQQEKLHRHIIPGQDAFESSGEALELCCNILENLKSATKLRRTRIGGQTNGTPLLLMNTLGFRTIQSSLGLDTAQCSKYVESLDEPLCLWDFRGTLRIPFVALQQVDFLNRVVSFVLARPQVPTLREDEQTKSTGIWQRFWDPFRLQCYRKITLYDADHDKTHVNQREWLETFLEAVGCVPELFIIGCEKTVQDCPHCVTSIEGVTEKASRNWGLRRLHLQNVKLNAGTLNNLLDGFKKQVQCLIMVRVMLSNSSFRAIFWRLLNYGFSSLNDVRIGHVYEPISENSRRPAIESEPRYEFVADGPNMRSLLDFWCNNFGTEPCPLPLWDTAAHVYIRANLEVVDEGTLVRSHEILSTKFSQKHIV